MLVREKMIVFRISIRIVLSIICAIIHKNKGYSPIAGFCWGFFFSIIGLIVVLLETNKAEHDAEVEAKKGLSMGQWLAIFLGIGIAVIMIFFGVVSHL